MNILNKKHLFLKIVIPAIAVFMLVSSLIGLSKNPKRETLPPQKPVAIAVYKSSIAGIGITEPQNEAIEIGTNISGIISQVYVKAGDKISQGENLFTIDDREAVANLDLKISQYEAAKLDAGEKRAEYEMYRKISDKRAYSQDEFNKKRVASEIASQKVKQAEAEIEVAKVVLDKSTVKSPIDGEVLKVNIHKGEFAQAGVLIDSLMTIGDLSIMHVRVEIDEVEAHLVSSNNSATAYLRGNPQVKIPLKFVRIEPKIVPKISISGANTQKIDSRVLQVIYSFENMSDTRILVGQQMDVYINKENSPLQGGAGGDEPDKVNVNSNLKPKQE